MRYHNYILPLICLLLTACQQRDNAPTITVTIEPLAWFADEISGESIPVQSMVPAGASPETYEPTPRQMVELSHTNIYIKVGCIGFETTWMKKLKANAPQMTVIDASNGVEYVESSDGIKDPHTWMSCTNARIIAKNIHCALVKAYPEEKARFDTGLSKLLAKIDSVENEVKTRLQHSSQRCFIIYHPALTYFARDHHLLQLPIEEEGREPNASSMQQLIEKAKYHRTQTIFVQQEFSPRNTISIRNATGAQAVAIHPLRYEWEDEMISVANALR